MADQLARLNIQAWALRFHEPLASAALANNVYGIALVRDDGAAAVQALFTLIHKSFYASDFSGALAYAEEALARSAGQCDELRARAYLRLGVAQIDAERFEEAMTTLQAAKVRLEVLGDEEGLAEVGQCLAYMQTWQGNFTAALALLNGAAARVAQDDAELARLEHLFCIVYFQLGQKRATAEHLERAFLYAERCGDRRRLALLLGFKGGLHKDEGKLAQALECYFSVLEGFRALEALGLGQSPLVADYLEHITNVYVRLGEFEQVLRYGQEALSVARQGQRQRRQAQILSVLGNVQRHRGEYSAARFLLDEAWAQALKYDDRHVQVLVHYQLGLLVLDSEPSEALKHFEAGLELARDNGLGLHETELCLVRAKALLALGRQGDAFPALQEALKLAERYGYKQLEAEAHELLAGYFREACDFEMAFRHFETFHLLSRVLMAEQMSERTRTLTLRFDLEQAEKTASLERQKNAELARVNAALEAGREQNEFLLAQLRAQAAELKQQARQDALTGVANRRHLEEQLERVFDEAKRYGRPLCVALLDIDDFKRINDTFSHQVGDEVLRAVSDLFGTFLRGTDIVARYGGEEFVIVFPHTTGDGGYQVCERIREAVTRYDWRTLHAELEVTLSIGLTDDMRVTNYEKLLTLADSKLYEAKRAGKNRVTR